jgi:surface antigen
MSSNDSRERGGDGRVVRSHHPQKALRRWFVAIAAVMVAAVSAEVASSTASAAARSTVNGVVVCNTGRPVVGVWVEASAGGSGWAGWTALPGRPNVATYSGPFQAGGTVSLHVGCGANGNQWLSDNWTPAIPTNGSKTINTWCNDANGPGAVRCVEPAVGVKTSRNLGVPGYCTNGALRLWQQATGFFPNWSGNAKKWGDTARANRWTVDSVPTPRSIVVFTSGTFGHVAWVENVRAINGALYVDLREMNYGKWVDQANGITDHFNQFTTRTLTNPTGLQYIHAPN